MEFVSRLVSVRLPSRPIDAREAASWPWTRWAVPLFAVAGLVLVPWIVLLVVLLPSAHVAAHWDIAWAGFDLALAVLLVTVALAAWKRPSWLEGAATATATLLFVDAWFDVLTSSTQAELVASLVEAVFIELPLAVLCVLLARDAERRFPRQMVETDEPQPARLRVVRGGQAAGEPSSRDDDRLSA